jgi:phage terminase small subunit
MFGSSRDKLFMPRIHYLVPEGRQLTEENVVEVGRITHFFSKISVAVIELKKPLKVGDTITIKGPTTDFEQPVDSMQIEHKDVQKAEAGQSIGLKVVQRVRETDVVYQKL